MKFELDGFEIEGSDRIGKFSKFNVYSLKTIEKGKHKGKVIRSPEWYDCSFEKALQTVIQLRMKDAGRKQNEKSLDNYISNYAEISEKTTLEIKKINTTLNEMILANEKSL